MLKIRLSRVGRKNRPLFRVVVTPKQAPAKSGYLKTLGTWDPVKKNLDIDKEELEAWLAKGAKTSNTVHNILIKEKLIEGKKIKISREKPAKDEGKQKETEAEKKEEPDKEKTPSKEEDSTEKEEKEEKPKEGKKTPAKEKGDKKTEKDSKDKSGKEQSKTEKKQK